MSRLAFRTAHRRQSGFRPHLEALESRDCPDAAPTLYMGIMSVYRDTVVLSGVVMDEYPAGLTVQFSGQYVGSTTTDSNGTFTVSVSPTALGAIFGNTTDNGGQASNTAQVDVTSNVPAILDFAAMRLVNNVYQFTGRVVDEHPEGLIVYFGGLPSLAGRSAVVNSDGTFTLVIELASGESGVATATTSDWWDQSCIAETYVSNAGAQNQSDPM